MKRSISFLMLIFLCFEGLSQFKAGETISISERYEGDLYAAAGTILVDAPVTGDLVVAGGELTISDTIHQDLLIGGGEIDISGHVLDDIRAMGGDLKIRGSVGGDLIVFGGNISIENGVEIGGNLVIFGGNVDADALIMGSVYAFGGELSLSGSVKNDLTMKGGDIKINAPIGGTAKLAGENIDLGDRTSIAGDLTYWTESGEKSFDQDRVGGRILYDESLAFEDEPSAWWAGSMAIGLFFWYIAAALLLLLVLQLLFGKLLANASAGSMDRLGENIGYGFLYVVGVPVIILVLLGIVIGIPLGLFLMFLYIFSLVFSYSIASLLFVNHLNGKRSEKWSTLIIVLLALGSTIVIRMISFIPFIGWLIGLIIITWAYGTVINHYRNKGKAFKNQ